MKIIITTLLLITSFFSSRLYAQDTEEPSIETETVTEKQIENTEDTPTEELEEGTLSEDVKVTQTPNITFGGILLAVFTPLLLIVIAYLLIKMSNR